MYIPCFGVECKPLLLLPSSGTQDCDSPLFLPYTTLVSTVGSMVFNEGEAQRLIEILSEKTGVTQDTWHKVGHCRAGNDSCLPPEISVLLSPAPAQELSTKAYLACQTAKRMSLEGLEGLPRPRESCHCCLCSGCSISCQ